MCKECAVVGVWYNCCNYLIGIFVYVKDSIVKI